MDPCEIIKLPLIASFEVLFIMDYFIEILMSFRVISDLVSLV
jgi:hypothetical protein